MKTSEGLRILFPQWAFAGVTLTATPEFVQRYVEKYRRPTSEQFPICGLRECSAPKRNHGIAPQRLGEVTERAGFHLAKFRLAPGLKNLRNGHSFAGLNLGIQIDEIPA